MPFGSRSRNTFIRAIIVVLAVARGSSELLSGRVNSEDSLSFHAPQSVARLFLAALCTVYLS